MLGYFWSALGYSDDDGVEHKSADIIKNTVMMYIQKRKYTKIRNSAITIQNQYRSYLKNKKLILLQEEVEAQLAKRKPRIRYPKRKSYRTKCRELIKLRAELYLSIEKIDKIIEKKYK